MGSPSGPAPPHPAPHTNAGVCADEQQCAVGAVGGEAKDGGVQVLVVARQVDERYHLGAALADLLCRPGVTVIHHLAQSPGLSMLPASLANPFRVARTSTSPWVTLPLNAEPHF